ncbi:hypothetical protein SAMN02746095_03845 [Acidocella aminolytica 101 = DSM 11237]|nr:hypothetical protein SAMN02746095_03845 [Acidocella aminolytica 101 = DSM 11237]
MNTKHGIWTHQAAKGPPDRALLRCAPPSPLQGLGPPGNDPLRNRGTDLGITNQPVPTSQRHPKGRQPHCETRQRTIRLKQHPPSVRNKHRQDARHPQGTNKPAPSLASSTPPVSNQATASITRLPQSPTRSVQAHSAGHETEPTSSPQPAPNHHTSPHARTTKRPLPMGTITGLPKPRNLHLRLFSPALRAFLARQNSRRFRPSAALRPLRGAGLRLAGAFTPHRGR